MMDKISARFQRQCASALATALVISAISCTAFSLPVKPQTQGYSSQLLDSVVKLYVSIQREDFGTPWQGGRPFSATGSGFIIGKRRILTNAHIVSDARFLEVQKRDDPRRYPARVTYSGHDCDLAVVTVDDPDFFKGAGPVVFSDDLPQLSDEVDVIGYPVGGDRLSITRGVVSRIDYSVYSHSGVDQHLVLQVDAAINPGNSGGPVAYGDKVVGLAFQGLMMGENIGYAIPVPVIRHFLDDIEDGTYHGYQELGVMFINTRNPAMRARLKIPGDGGVAVSYVDPFGSGEGYLRPGDVLMSVDGRDIAYDGTIQYGSQRVVFAEMVERKQWGETAIFEVWRNGEQREVRAPLRTPADPFVFRNIYDQRPEYLITAGLVFSPLTRGYLNALRGDMSSDNKQQLYYYSIFVKPDGLYKDRDEIVVLTRRLPHDINAYAERFANGIVEEVNGKTIGNMSHLKAALNESTDGFHVFRFAGMEDYLVIDAAKAEAAGERILEAYGVSDPEHIDED